MKFQNFHFFLTPQVFFLKHNNPFNDKINNVKKITEIIDNITIVTIYFISFFDSEDVLI